MSGFVGRKRGKMDIRHLVSRLDVDILCFHFLHDGFFAINDEHFPGIDDYAAMV